MKPLLVSFLQHDDDDPEDIPCNMEELSIAKSSVGILGVCRDDDLESRFLIMWMMMVMVMIMSIPAHQPLYEPDGLLTNKSATKKPANCLVVKIRYRRTRTQYKYKIITLQIQ